MSLKRHDLSVACRGLATFFVFALLGSAPADAAKPRVYPVDVLRNTHCNPREASASPAAASDAAEALRSASVALEADDCQLSIVDDGIAIAKDPNDIQAYVLRAFAQGALAGASLKSSAFDPMIDDLTHAIALSPKSPGPWELRGWAEIAKVAVLDREGKVRTVRQFRSATQTSYADLSKALTLDPTFGEAYAIRWTIDKVDGTDADLAYDLQKAQELDPSYVAAVQGVVDRIAERQREADARRDALIAGIAGVAQAQALESTPYYVYFY